MNDQIQTPSTTPAGAASALSAGLCVAWGAFTTTNEYGAHGKCLGWFSTEQAAKKAAVGKGWYGGDGVIEQRHTLTVGGKTYLLESETPITIDATDENREKKRAAALMKLSQEEREALGYA